MATLLCSTSVSDVVSVVGSIINVVNGKKWLTHIYFFLHWKTEGETSDLSINIANYKNKDL